MQKPRRLVLRQVPERSDEACNEALKQLPAWFNQIAFRAAHKEDAPLPIPIALSTDEARLEHLEKLLNRLGYGCKVEIVERPEEEMAQMMAGYQKAPSATPPPSNRRAPSAPPGVLGRPTPATELDAITPGEDGGPGPRPDRRGTRETVRLPAEPDPNRTPPAMLVRLGVLGVLIVALCVLILRMGDGQAPAQADAPTWEAVSGPGTSASIPMALLTFFIGIGGVAMAAYKLGLWRPVAPGARRPRLDTRVGVFGLALLAAGYGLLLTTSWDPTAKLKQYTLQKLAAMPRAPAAASDGPSAARNLNEPAPTPWGDLVAALPEIQEPENPEPVFPRLFEVLLPSSKTSGRGGASGPSCAGRMDSLPPFSRMICKLEIAPPLAGSNPTFRSLIEAVKPQPTPQAPAATEQAEAAPGEERGDSPTPTPKGAPEAAKKQQEPAAATPASAPAPAQAGAKTKAPAAPAKVARPPAVRPAAPPPALSRDEIVQAWWLGGLRLLVLSLLLGVLVGGVITFLLRLLVRLHEREARS
jgi:hypothetical protein